MKKIFGKKGTRKPSAGEASFLVNDKKRAEKERELLDCENQKSQDISLSETTENFCLRFDNPDFSDRESNIFSINSKENNIISTTRSVSDILHQRNAKDSSETAGLSINELNGSESRNSVSEKSKKLSTSHDFFDQVNRNLLLRKTEEISDFNLKSFNDIKIMENDNLQCKVESLALKNEKRPRRSDLFERDAETSFLSEINLKEGQTGNGNKIDKKLGSVRFRHKRAGKNRPIENQKKKKIMGLWSLKSFNKAVKGNLFSGEKKNLCKSTTITQLNLTVKEDPKSKILRKQFVEPEVSLKEDLETKKYFKDLFIYLVYLVTLTTVAMSMVSATMYYFTDLTASLFLDSENTASFNTSQDTESELLLDTFKPKLKYGHDRTLRNARTIDDFWNFAESTMVDIFYWNFFYFGKNADDHTEEDDKKMFYETHILGVPRIRQVRVTNHSCLIHPDVKRFFSNCYHYYSPLTEDTEPIKKGMEASSTATAWVYTKAEKLKSSYYWGEISVYGGGGYYLDLDISKEKTKEMIKELKENVWISGATRALFIDFSLYNANVNLFCLCKIVLEFPPVGGIIPKADFHSLKLIRYLTTFDFFVLGCEFLLIVFVFYFTWDLFQKAHKQKTTFFFSFWNYLDLIIVLLLSTFIILCVIRYLSTEELINQLNDHLYEYTEVGFAKDIQINFNNVIAVLLFVCWMKLFMFLTFNIIMLEFKKTLKRSLVGVFGFLPMLIITYLAFAFLANLLFGNQVKDYSTVWFSFLTLLKAPLGEFQYSQILELNRILGPIFYAAFIFFFFFVLLNVFIAIISNEYSKVKSESLLMRPKVGEYAKRIIINLMTCFRPPKKLKKEKLAKKKLFFFEICKAFEKAGFTKNEIRIFFSKYKINVSNILDDNTRMKVMEDLELRRVDFSDDARHTQLHSFRRRLDGLNFRVEDMEMNLQPVIDKVDILIDRLSSKKYL